MFNNQTNSSVPTLNTSITGPLLALEQHLLDRYMTIETWFRKQWINTPAPFYCSIDLRNAGFKLAPVDTNLFPAGFNNLNPQLFSLYIAAAQSTLENQFPGCERIVLIPENHTRNVHYLESLNQLKEILSKAGYQVRIGSLLPELTSAKTFDLPSGQSICLEPLFPAQGSSLLEQFSPCLILLNNDFSEGIPPSLKNLSPMIHPPLSLGWSQRLKSSHFRHYAGIATEFAQLVDIDPWFINPLFRNCGEVNFKEREGEEELAETIDELLKEIQVKYDHYQIKEKPYVFVKADAGTYGMAVMAISNSDELRQLNRKQREKMSASKGRQPVTKVLIQEGIYSFETMTDRQAVAEPVVYCLGHHVIGGFYRLHQGRNYQESLNAPGMEFEPLAFVDSCTNPDFASDPNAIPNRFYVYGVIARLALLAAARELQQSKAT